MKPRAPIWVLALSALLVLGGIVCLLFILLISGLSCSGPETYAGDRTLEAMCEDETFPSWEEAAVATGAIGATVALLVTGLMLRDGPSVDRSLPSVPAALTAASVAMLLAWQIARLIAA